MHLTESGHMRANLSAAQVAGQQSDNSSYWSFARFIVYRSQPVRLLLRCKAANWCCARELRNTSKHSKFIRDFWKSKEVNDSVCDALQYEVVPTMVRVMMTAFLPCMALT